MLRREYQVKPRVWKNPFRQRWTDAISEADTDSLPSRFGKNVALLRALVGLTQEQAAEAIGISTRYFQSVEAGEYVPSLPTLLRLRQTLDGKWNTLLEGCKSA